MSETTRGAPRPSAAAELKARLWAQLDVMAELDEFRRELRSLEVNSSAIPGIYRMIVEARLRGAREMEEALLEVIHSDDAAPQTEQKPARPPPAAEVQESDPVHVALALSPEDLLATAHTYPSRHVYGWGFAAAAPPPGERWASVILPDPPGEHRYAALLLQEAMGRTGVLGFAGTYTGRFTPRAAGQPEHRVAIAWDAQQIDELTRTLGAGCWCTLGGPDVELARYYKNGNLQEVYLWRGAPTPAQAMWFDGLIYFHPRADVRVLGPGGR